MLSVEHGSDGVSRITFDRPEVHNAMDWPTMAAFARAIDDLHLRCLDLETGPRVLILVGAGERAFCSGGDQHALHSFLSREDGQRLAATMGDALRSMEQLPIPVIAAVNGYALGGGSEIALACDLRIVSEDVRFGLVHLKLGLIPGWGAGQRLLRLVGHGRAAQMLLSARPYGAEELMEMGLASQVTNAGRALPAAVALAEGIAQSDPATVRAAKRLLAAGRMLSYPEALEVERSMFPGLWEAEAHVKAVARFKAGGKNA